MTGCNGKVALYYNELQDALEVWAKRTGEEWEMSTSCRYRRSDKDNPMTDCYWIHNALINDLIRWVERANYKFIGTVRKRELENNNGEEDEE